MRKIIIVLVLFFITPCLASDHSPDQKASKKSKHHHENVIHTYGGGETLQTVFNTVSMLIYGGNQGKLGELFRGFLRISMTFGAFYCICLALFRNRVDILLTQFFLPALGIMTLLMLPRTTVHIQDHIVEKSPSSQESSFVAVDNVPFFLAKFASLVSELSYIMTTAFEGVSHGVNTKIYNWTGHIYAGENIFRAKKWKITDPTLEDNFREFCRECVFRDIGIGLYSKKDLVHAPNLLKFLEDNTSKIRTMLYKQGKVLDNGVAQKDSYFVSCKDAISRMNLILKGKLANTQEILLGETGSKMQFLLKQQGQNDLENLIKQQMAIDILKEEMPGHSSSFAAKRAEVLQKENQKIFGALGARSIIILKNYIEALIYMVFPLVILFSLLCMAFKPLINWVQSLVWISTWPIFYVVVNFMLDSIWAYKTKQLCGGDLHLTVFSSEGLCDLYSSMESTAAMAMALIPFISLALLKGGIAQIVHFSSSLAAPAQTAASATATESVYGNYSQGNLSLDNLNGYNAQVFKQSYSGMLSQGTIGLDTGVQTSTYSPTQDSLFLRQGDSHLREGISRTETFSSALQDSLSNSETAVSESSRAYTESVSDTTNKGVGLVEAIARNNQFGENFNTQNMTSAQKSAQSILGTAEDYAKSQGVSRDEALRELASLSLSSGGGLGRILGVKGDAQFSMQDGVSSYSSDAFSEKASYAKNFQEQLQSLSNFSSGEMASVLGSEDVRLHEDFVHSYNDTKSTAEQLRAAYSQQQALSEVKNYSESDNVSFHQNLNQRFIDFLQEKYNDVGLVNDVLDLPSHNLQKESLVKEFTKDYLPQNVVKESGFSAGDSYHKNLDDVTIVSENNFQLHSLSLKSRGEEKVGFSSGDGKLRVETMKQRMTQESENYIKQIKSREEGIGQNYADQKMVTEQETDRSLWSHAGDHMKAPKIVANTWDSLFGKSEENHEK